MVGTMIYKVSAVKSHNLKIARIGHTTCLDDAYHVKTVQYTI